MREKPMSSINQCAICGSQSSNGVDILDHFLCSFCQTLLDNPKMKKEYQKENMR